MTKCQNLEFQDLELEKKITNLQSEIIDKRDKETDNNKKKYYRKLSKKFDCINIK